MDTLTIPVSRLDHSLGDENAAVSLLEYGDFECPFCGAAHPIVKSIIEKLGDQLYFVFRHFPLSQVHHHATHAAFAAEAAGRQDKFWPMHDHLFRHQHRLDDESLFQYVTELGLDQESFLQDFRSDEVSEKVRHDFMSGVRSGVAGTPTFFINGRRFDGSYENDELLETLEGILE